MSHDDRMSDLHRRLDGLERRLAEKQAEISKNRAVPTRLRERIDEIYAKARATRQKLLDSELSPWDAVKHEFESDWEGLTASFEEWVERMDEEHRAGRL